MPHYMLSVCHDGTENFEAMTPEEMQPMFDSVNKFNDEVQQAGKWVYAGGLGPLHLATTVDNTAGQRLVTDGPYVESKEYVGGFWIIASDDLDEALEWAQRGSAACGARVEVRPLDAA